MRNSDLVLHAHADVRSGQPVENTTLIFVRIYRIDFYAIGGDRRFDPQFGHRLFRRFRIAAFDAFERVHLNARLVPRPDGDASVRVAQGKRRARADIERAVELHLER